MLREIVLVETVFEILESVRYKRKHAAIGLAADLCGYCAEAHAAAVATLAEHGWL
jgi:hypothetical protein